MGIAHADATVMCEVPVAPSLSARDRIRIPDLSVTIGGDSDLIEEQDGCAVDVNAPRAGRVSVW